MESLHQLINVVYFLLLGIKEIAARSIVNESKLQTDLLASYSSNVRPTDQVLIVCSLDIRNILALNIVDQTLAVTGLLSVGWQDSRLSWNISDYGGVTRLYYKPSQIWRPTLVLQNSVTGIEVIGDSGNQKSIPVTVNFPGNVFWLAPAYFISFCSVQISKFPFDSQTCEIVISAWLYTNDIVKLMHLRDDILLDVYEENGEYDIIRTFTRVDHVPLFSKSVQHLVFGLELKRKYSYYLVNVILPVFFTQLLGIVVFAVPIDSGEKLTFSLTLLLSMTVMMTLIAEKIPTTSLQIPILSKYLLGGSIISSLELIMTVVILHFEYSEVEVDKTSNRKKNFACRLAGLTYYKTEELTRQRQGNSKGKNERNPLDLQGEIRERKQSCENTPDIEKKISEVFSDSSYQFNNKDIANMMDRLSLFVFSIITFVFTLTMTLMILF